MLKTLLPYTIVIPQMMVVITLQDVASNTARILSTL